MALLQAGVAFAQKASPADPAVAEDHAKATNPSDDQSSSDVVVTGTRVQRAGFDAPTPTTVLGEVDLRMGDRPGIAQVLDDLPQFRGTTQPSTQVSSTNNNATTADLRGLGALRTLTLLDGHRSLATSFDLNNVPQILVKRVDVVTGGASAAWGSGAVAGVVNIILDDGLKGFTVGASSGISSRGDGQRSSVDASYGTSFADGRGHVMMAGEYVNDEGIFDRNGGSRPNLDSAIFQTATGQLILANNVNSIASTPGGIITSGALAGQTFNPAGTLSPLSLGSQSNSTVTVGGNSRSTQDYVPVSAPFKRVNLYGRATFDVSDAAKFWVDVSYSRMWDNFGFFPAAVTATATSGGLVFQKNNPFLSPAVQALLASGPQTFRVGRILGDIGSTGIVGYDYHRENREGSVGVDGALGGSWNYSIYYDHGELRNEQSVYNQRITANFNNAIDAVINPVNGQIVCRVALTNPSTSCAPINLFGEGNASPAAVAYAFGGTDAVTTQKLDAVGASLRGDPFETWAGPVSIAVGADFRWEKLVTNYVDPLSLSGSFATFNASAINGGFNVKEGFGEVVVPLLDLTDVAKLDVNGAARYSDYSNSGGIWSWKTGGTLRLANDLLLRAVYSRDIRSPAITELYAIQSTTITSVIDPFRNNQVTPVTRYTGGNPDLKPELSHTLTLGGSYAPHFVRGVNLSVDYYNIKIDNVIATISAQDSLNQCYAGNTAACSTIVRGSTGVITTLYGNSQNLAFYKTRGVDIEASYVLPMAHITSKLNGALRFRVLATYVDRLIINDGVNTYDRAGDVGDNASFTTPKWKATGNITYQSDKLGVDLRVRYVGGGQYNHLQAIVNNAIDSRTYVDLGANYKIGSFMIYGQVNNLFDRQPPYIISGSAIYDAVGRYFSGGVKVKF